MQAKMLKDFFERGLVKGVSILPEPMSKGWALSFNVMGDETPLETARGGVRVFSSLDTVVSALEQITGRKPVSLTVGV